ncbi:MAG: uroporphyrinogen-III C-methyltransferase [Chromatiales bacterium]|nr:uroporphyrinogen-III C-methyltransferase [Chromatiales bacterium]
MTNDDKHASNDAQNGPAEEVEVEEVVAEPVDEPAEPAARGRGAIAGAWLVALLALAAGGGGIGAGWWLWQQQQATNADHDAALAALEERIERIDTTDEVASLRRELAEEAQALRATTTAADREIGNLKDAVGALHDVAMRDQRGWMVAEIEYLIDIANQRLRLVRDLDGAIAALRAADQRVRELGDPKLLPIRELLADEIAMLEDFERPDLVGIALRLDRMATHLKPMPLQLPDQERAERDLSVAVEDGEQKTMAGLARHVWNAFSEHITYREYPEPVKALPDTETELHLNQLLRLRLEAARLSVLRQDDAEYHRQLLAARTWVEEKFTGERAAELAAELAALDAVNLRPELPELTASLDKLHELERRPASSGAPAAAEPEADAP